MQTKDEGKRGGSKKFFWLLLFFLPLVLIFGLPFMMFGLAASMVVLPMFLYRAYAKVHFDYNEVKASLSNIDVHLRKRYDTLPNLFKSVKHAMAHEKALLKEIVELRNSAPSFDHRVDSGDLDSELAELSSADTKVKNLMVTMENYPELKSIESVNRAMSQLERIESDIAAARSVYNGCVHANNTNSDTWPHSWFFLLAGMDRQPYYQDPEPEKINQSFDVDAFLAS